MPERVIVTLPSGAVSEGYYTVDGCELTMTYADGTPVQIEGAVQRWLLQPDQKAAQVAGYMTRQIRRAMNNQTEASEEFGRALNYPRQGVA